MQEDIIDISGFYSKYCHYCKLFFIKNYKNIICENCKKKCNNFTLTTLFYYKPLILNNNYLIEMIWKLYDFNIYYTFTNYKIFENLIKKIFKIISNTYKTTYNDFIFYIVNAYLLNINRNKNNNLGNNIFCYELNMLILDFYFATINLNDFNVSFTYWKNYIKKSHYYYKDLYLFYVSYLRKLNYNINININYYYFILEYIINNS